MNSVFSDQILADKLSKLNSTQQCIETLSHWCIFHRSKAEVVVETWKKQFDKSEMVQKVPLLYLANDILQNSKRKGNEFVTEFWKVLPSALKYVDEKGDDHEKKVASRLVDIWEQRRVFGSRAKNLKDLMLAEEAPTPLQFSKKRSRSGSLKIVKRDSRSIKLKLSIGGPAEKIVSAFHSVLTEQSIEDAEMSKSKSAIQHMKKMENDVDIACSIAMDPKRKTLSKELEKEENTLKQCIEKLKLVEANRVVLVSHLKEALHEQEADLENIRTQMLVAQAKVEEASIMRARLDNEDSSQKATTATTSPAVANGNSEAATKKSAAAIAAEVADKLTASSSSQLIMTSVLSTFAAEEAKSAGPTSSESTTQQLIAAQNHSYPSVLVTQPILQDVASASQGQYPMLCNPSTQQYVRSTGAAHSPYYVSISPVPVPLPQPPPPAHVAAMMPLPHQTLPIMQQQSIPVPQRAPAPPSFRPLQPPGMVYYTNPQQSI
ncbi:hypothetical protein HN51_031053 [Arachis hypogaea]|uniref:CID domain-containing protein n=1 Tax=Arachis hypogaea TaxID=3818 RepID=A0A445B8Q7_ARAHY|nr:regulation of nuclear pre-mRNA domain-containing protein 1B [Arachis hypogaea]QHO15638.1 Regulation of nuclear pre-mRNA domain-containing protein 1B [Arachis hypogaea]RYR35051.1 hypothetical protein Ahy_A10g050150 [Arachis hypogaea]